MGSYSGQAGSWRDEGRPTDPEKLQRYFEIEQEIARLQQDLQIAREIERKRAARERRLDGFAAEREEVRRRVQDRLWERPRRKVPGEDLVSDSPEWAYKPPKNDQW